MHIKLCVIHYISEVKIISYCILKDNKINNSITSFLPKKYGKLSLTEILQIFLWRQRTPNIHIYIWLNMICTRFQANYFCSFFSPMLSFSNRIPMNLFLFVYLISNEMLQKKWCLICEINYTNIFNWIFTISIKWVHITWLYYWKYLNLFPLQFVLILKQ